ncbi:aldo/keto reductase [Helicobacter didelphidarum]|nr:aldo/keto reductase [Helicobacter didelphidarum]
MKNDRREFLKTSGRFGVVSTFFGLNSLHVFGADSKQSKSEYSNNEVNSMPSQNPFLKLNNGIQMPFIGLGTYELRGKSCIKAMQDALKVGYRLFDTAQMYENEKEVGIGINTGLKTQNISRKDIFVTTKLSNDMDYKETKKQIDIRLKNLNLEYIDLLLLHREFDNSEAMWKAMQEAYKMGKIKSLGLSNFSQEKFLSFIKSCEIQPVLNQLETHVFFQRNKYQKILNENHVVLQAWSPFSKGKNDFFSNKTLLDIGKKYNKTPAQVGLRYLIERNISVVPKTSNIDRMKENIAIFDFKLDSKDLSVITNLDTQKSSFGWFKG